MLEVYELKEPFKLGKELKITGTVLKTDKPYFSVNLCATKEITSAVFHFNPRLYTTWFWNSRLVMNTMRDGKWMEGENVTPFHLEVGSPFTLTIKHAEKGFEVDMSNGFRYCYLHQKEEPIRFVLIRGDVEVKNFDPDGMFKETENGDVIPSKEVLKMPTEASQEDGSAGELSM